MVLLYSHNCFQDISVACGICYAYRLDAQIPDQVCEDSRCAQPFHQTCLYEVCNSSPIHVKCYSVWFIYLKNFFGHQVLFWATDINFGYLVTSVLGFKAGWIPHLHALLPVCNGFLRFTSAVTHAGLIFDLERHLLTSWWLTWQPNLFDPRTCTMLVIVAMRCKG